ncbi:MAG: endonuclease/exonuclease/phosphatase family protein [Pseudomonadota bacterium]
MAAADTLRVATWHVELMRDGPGLLVRDIEKGDPQVDAVVQILDHVAPDVVLLTGIDWDFEGIALAMLAEKLGRYPHRLALKPNTGMPTVLDLDGDGLLGGPGDAQGYGRFAGHGGMALLSDQPMTLIADHTHRIWADIPGALLFEGMTDAAKSVQRLSSVGHWEVEVAGLRLLAMSAGPPVFDGPEDRNGRRNDNELAFWSPRLERGSDPVVLIGNTNLDPVDGDGRREIMQAMLSHPRLQDPKPRSGGGVEAANLDHRGDPALDTADWREPSPGNLRVSYVLPDSRLAVRDAGVFWPTSDDPKAELLSGGPRHRLVWVDLER